MAHSEPEGDYNAPNERSTVALARTDDYTYRTTKTPANARHRVRDHIVNDVFDALVDWLAELETRQSVTSGALVDRVEYRKSMIGRALAALCDDRDCPVELTQWASRSGNNEARWLVERGGDDDE